MSSAGENENPPKLKGNACMKEGNYIEAAIHYSHAIKQDPDDCKVYSNRSLAFLKLDQFYFSLEDAEHVILLDPNWAKGYYRKGEALYHCQHYKEAVDSYKLGLYRAPDDPGLQDALKKAQAAYSKQSKEEFRYPIYSAIGGFALGLMIVIMDQTMTKVPALQHVVLQAVIVLVFSALGYGASKLLSFMNRKTRESLLQSPSDLLGEFDSPTVDAMTEEAQKEVPDKFRRRSGPTAGKQKMRKAKKS